jgi:hypothetical protein
MTYIPIEKEKLAPVKDILLSFDLFVKLPFQNIGQFDKIMFMRRGKETIFKINPGSPHPMMKQKPGVHHHEGEALSGIHSDYRYEIVKTPGSVRVKGYKFPLSGIRDQIGVAGLCFQQK